MQEFTVSGVLAVDKAHQHLDMEVAASGFIAFQEHLVKHLSVFMQCNCSDILMNH